jgi:hypothetical protein
MPRFHLNIRQRGDVVEDIEGIELPNLDAAVENAMAAAREMIAEGVKANDLSAIQCAFEIADEAGVLLRIVWFAESLHDDFPAPQQRGSIH